MRKHQRERRPSTNDWSMIVKGWTTRLFTVEVGNLLTKVRVRGHKRKTAARRVREAAERASCWHWHKREDTSWKPGGEGQ